MSTQPARQQTTSQSQPQPQPIDKSAPAKLQRGPTKTRTDAQAKRDAKLKDCLAGKNLPPRDPPAPGR